MGQGAIFEFHSEEYEPVPVSEWHSIDDVGCRQLHALRTCHSFEEGVMSEDVSEEVTCLIS